MKKLIQFLTISSFSLELVTNTISCTKQKYDSDVWLITDGLSSIKDQSIQEYAYDGANDYVHQNKGKDYDASFYELAGSTANDFYNGYKIAKIAGAKAAVLPGFSHVPYLDAANKYLPNVVLQDSANLGSNGKPLPHIVGLTYQAEISGFKASLLTFFYMNKIQGKASGRKNPFLYGTFAGGDMPPVYTYLWGIISAQILFDDYINGDVGSQYLDNIMNDFGLHKSDLLPFQLVDFQNKDYNAGTMNKSNWFSNGFNIGQGKVIANKLVNDGKADLILPAAAGQTSDVLYEANLWNKNLKIIGVDTPQGEFFNSKYDFPANKTPIVTSALKDMKDSTNIVLKDLLDGDPDKLAGTTINAPIDTIGNGSNAISTDDWTTIDQDNLPSGSQEWFKNGLNDVNNFLKNTKYSEWKGPHSDDLTNGMVNYFTAYAGKSFADLLSANHKSDTSFEKEIIQHIS